MVLCGKRPKMRTGSPAWIRTTIHGSKGRCPTIRRPGNGSIEPVYPPRPLCRNVRCSHSLPAVHGQMRNVELATEVRELGRIERARDIDDRQLSRLGGDDHGAAELAIGRALQKNVDIFPALL